MNRFALIVPLALLTACATSAAIETPMDRNQLAGSKLKLTQTLTIPGGSAGVTLQDGQPMNPKDINRYYPHCRLEVNDVRETPQTVQPDEFHVRRMFQLDDTAEGPGLLRVRRLHIGSGVSFILYRTVLELKSTQQPQVRTLTCQHWGDPAVGRHLSLNQVRLALGKVMILTTAGRDSL